MYLEDIPLPEALSRLDKALEAANIAEILGQEQLPVDKLVLGRTLAEPVWAKISSPHYHSAAMDGFAVRSVETEGAMATQPVNLLVEDQALYIDTGNPLPEFADAVIPIENVESLDPDGNPAVDPRHPHEIRIRSAVTPWMHVRTLGEDIVATELVLPAGHKLRPIDLGVIAASGNSDVRVALRPRVAIIPTGSELVPIGSQVSPGDIIEFNSLVLAGQVEEWGGDATGLPITADDFELICDSVRQAAMDYDLILINAGSSAGSEDFSARVVQELGELFVHGVAVRPGHPVILGMLETSSRDSEIELEEGVKKYTPVIGVPGYPVSAAITGEIFVEPLLARWLGRSSVSAPTIRATLTRKITSPPGDDDYVRVAVGQVGERILAAPLARGAGVITSLVRADGLALLPRGSQGLPAGSELEVRLYRSQEEINKTIFATGSHDITLDLIAQFLHGHDRRLTASNVGSIAGLVSLSKKEAHLAGSHLLDPATGEFNLSYVEQYLADIPVKVVALVGREQGLLVAKGNPKQIKSLADLTREDVRFVNRQRGAGTRVLLDYQLEQLGVWKGDIRGYDSQEFTHLAVGAAIASGRADCGMGIAAVTQSLELDFVPLFAERYDLVILQEFFNSSLMKPLFGLFENGEFRRVVASLPGYNTEPMGKVIAELPAKQE
ncbi:MAG: molybdopterin biosynthesis protein [Chloroflexota bacterium]|nr:MAG: molybdopterin biosynthesis protein [Chloroflexota bacterium]